MVTTEATIEVRPVGLESFDEIYPLLELFANPKMSRDDWRRMLFSYSWWDGRERGYAIFADGVPVGFIGTILSKRRVLGRDQMFCNTSSWIVREEYRSASLLLLKPILAMRECTIVNATPTKRSYDIFVKLGFRGLEDEQIVALPIVSPLGIVAGSFTSDPERIREGLREDERAILAQLSSSADVCHVLLRRGARTCYLVATRQRVKRMPFAAIHYVGDPEFLGENRALAHYAFLRAMGAAGIVLDGRFAKGGLRRLVFRRPAKRLYRPAWPETPPEAIDSLFSELMTLKV
jgi:hypothetical protein